MEPSLEFLLFCQRSDIEETKTLGRLNEEKLCHILSNIVSDCDGCWHWKGFVNDNRKGHQHGKMLFKNNYRLVHRLMYHNFVENVPEYVAKSGCLQVNHSCSHTKNGRCVNPSHMYLGTPKDNMQDALRDGTKNKAPCGQNNYNAHVSDDAVRQAKSLRNNGLSHREIAKQIGVNPSQISRWLSGKTRSQNTTTETSCHEM